MSFIHLSTVQPTIGQRENTEREPAMFRNDFKNGIEIKKGDQIELVNLRLNFENIVITSGINDTLVWQIGPSPAFTQHVVILEEGEYTQDAFVNELQRALNKSVVLESMKPQIGDTANGGMNNPKIATLPGGFNVLFEAKNPTANPPVPTDTYIISVNQQLGPQNDDTLNTEANLAFAATKDWTELGTRIANVPWINNNVSNIKEGNLDDLDPLKEQPSTITSLTMEKLVQEVEGSGELVDFNTFREEGGAVEWDRDNLSSIKVLGYDGSIIQEFPNGLIPREITGIFDKQGRTTLRICPILGFQTADFTTAAPTFAVASTLTFGPGEIHQGLIAMTPAPAKYDFSFTVSAGGLPINPEDGSVKADGTPRTAVTVIYGKFSDTIQDLVDDNNFNGGLRFAAGKGDTGTGGEPDADPNTEPDTVDLKSELWGLPEDNSFFYYSSREGFFEAFKDVEDGPGGDLTYYRIPWNATDLPGDPDETTVTPSLKATANVGYNVLPTKVLGWPCARLGLNRRARVVKDGYGTVNRDDPYDNGVVDARGNHEWAEYWIGICKQTDGVDPLAVAGTTEPIVEICCPQDIEGRREYPDGDFLGSEIKMTRYLKDVTGAPTSPTQDIILEIKLDDFNHITMSVAQDTSQDFERGSTVLPKSYPSGIPSQLPPNIGFTLVGDSHSQNEGPGAATPLKLNNQLKECHFPYIPMAFLSRGGPYQAKNTQDQTLMNQTGYAAMYSFDGAIGTDMVGIRNQRIVREPDISLDRVFPNYGDILSGGEYTLPAFYKFGRVLLNSNLVGPDQDAATGLPYDDDQQEFWENYDSPQAAMSIRDFQLEPNIANLDEYLGMRNVVSNVATAVVSSTVTSTNTPNSIPISEVFNVELLSEPVKSHNGATNDIGKSIHTVLANNVRLDADNRSLSYTPPVRLPVDLNVMEDKTVYSLTVAVKDLNNKLIPGLKAPSDVTLYKSQSELSKLEKQTELIRDAIIGKNNDRNDIKVSNIGIHNPILGVIPK